MGKWIKANIFFAVGVKCILAGQLLIGWMVILLAVVEVMFPE